MATKPHTPETFWARVQIGAANECWPFVGARGNQYGHGCIRWDGKLRRAHRVAYQIATGVTLSDETKLRPDTQCVLHTCDNPICCNPAHLRLGTQRENIREALLRKRLLMGNANPSRRLPECLARGSANGRAKLTTEDIITIRARFTRGDTQAAIANDYGMAVSTIQRILYRRIWKHV